MVDSREPKRTPVEIVDEDELSLDDERDRLKLEREVERAFYKAGCALRELRDRRLYRSTHRTFQEYCQDRFGFTRRRSDYLIGAAEVVDNLSSKVEPMLKRGRCWISNDSLSILNYKDEMSSMQLRKSD